MTVSPDDTDDDLNQRVDKLLQVLVSVGGAEQTGEEHTTVYKLPVIYSLITILKKKRCTNITPQERITPVT